MSPRGDSVVPGDRLKLSAIDDAAPSRWPISPRYLYLYVTYISSHLPIYRQEHTDVLSTPLRGLPTPPQSLHTRGVAWGHGLGGFRARLVAGPRREGKPAGA